MHFQPHTPQCRTRIEKLLEGDKMVMNAKARVRERAKRVRETEGITEEEEHKKRRL